MGNHREEIWTSRLTGHAQPENSTSYVFGHATCQVLCMAFTQRSASSNRLCEGSSLAQWTSPIYIRQLALSSLSSLSYILYNPFRVLISRILNNLMSFVSEMVFFSHCDSLPARRAFHDGLGMPLPVKFFFCGVTILRSVIQPSCLPCANSGGSRGLLSKALWWGLLRDHVLHIF